MNKPKRISRDDWLRDMLKMQEALDSTIHSMIAYKITAGPWGSKDANDGWRVLKGIVAANEKKLHPQPPSDEEKYALAAAIAVAKAKRHDELCSKR
jgi:hypothetical protein